MRQLGIAAAANSARRVTRGVEATTSPAITMASGTIFGRVNTAAETARPAPSAASGPGISASTQANSHQAVTGTSLIGSSVWNMKVGLNATKIAAIIPVTGRSTRAPST